MSTPIATLTTRARIRELAVIVLVAVPLWTVLLWGLVALRGARPWEPVMFYLAPFLVLAAAVTLRATRRPS